MEVDVDNRCCRVMPLIMRVVIAPDSFKESMTAAAAASAMARGVLRACPEAECVEVPMADGGEGTTAALVAASDGRWQTVRTRDALGRPLAAHYGLLSGGRAVVEVAAAAGLEQIAPSDRDVMASTSRGVGDLVRDALDAGATRIIVGLGGSATTDCGAGMLSRLGAEWLDSSGHLLDPSPNGLATLDRVDLSGLDPRVRAVRIDLACDVTNPLLGPAGSAAVFGPQKGAASDQVAQLDDLLTRIADALVAAGCPDVREQAGAGAAGGLGAAFLALGAHRHPGVALVAEAAGLDAAVAGADLVLTGEGSLDRQTLAGKTPAGVAAVAAAHQVPVIAFAGRLGEGASELEDGVFAAVWSISSGPGTLADALRSGERDLERAVTSALRTMNMLRG